MSEAVRHALIVALDGKGGLVNVQELFQAFKIIFQEPIVASKDINESGIITLHQLAYLREYSCRLSQVLCEILARVNDPPDLAKQSEVKTLDQGDISIAAENVHVGRLVQFGQVKEAELIQFSVTLTRNLCTIAEVLDGHLGRIIHPVGADEIEN